jgi:hypothetical protein
MIAKIMLTKIQLFFFAALATVLLNDSAKAQHYYKDVELIRDNRSLMLSGLGGINAPQYSNIDLNNDGRQDIIIYDKTAKTVFPLLHTGGVGALAYRFAPEYQAAFPQDAENFLLAYDYNCDGVEDIFYFKYTDVAFGIVCQKGSYDSQNRIQFAAATDFIRYEQRGQLDILSTTSVDLPTFGDVDGDGDMDMLTFGISFTFYDHVSFYQNMSQERGYGCDSILFLLKNECFGQFAENQTSNTITMSGRTDSCANNPFWRTPRHFGSTLAMIDHDRDGSMDLVMGDIGARSLNLITMRTIGDTLVAIQEDNAFPSYDTSADIFNFPAAFFVDVNNDGRTDCIAANTEGNFDYANDSTSWLYINQAAQNMPMQLQLQSRSFLYDDMIDLGTDAHPAFTDLNGDGLLDLVVGNGYLQRRDSSVRYSLYAFLNIGSDSAPIFELINEDFAGLSALNLSHLYPTFGDIDSDGDADMLVGFSDGTAALYLNQSAAGQLPTYAAAILNLVSVPSMLAPCFYDIDGDGDLDIIAGEEAGKLNFFRNNGTSTAYNFANAATNAQFGLFTTNLVGAGRTVPAVTNIGGQTQIFVGFELGSIIKLGNIDGNLSGKFDSLQADYLPARVGRFSAPAIADIDGDSMADMVVGNGRGGLSFFTSRQPVIVGSQILENSPTFGVNIYPNPAKNILYIDSPASEILQATLFNSTGQQVLSGLQIQNGRNTLSLSDLPAGCYYLRLQGQNGQQTAKIIVAP